MDHASKKRKPSTSIEKSAKKPRPQTDDATTKGPSPPQAQDSPLFRPHAPILQELATKYNILPASVISSTPIRKRLVLITSHLIPTATATATKADDDDEVSRAVVEVEAQQEGKTKKKPRAVLLYARPAEVCKMITVAETCKRLLAEAGQTTWYQYNQLFDLPREDAERTKRKMRRPVVEETVLRVDEEEDNNDEDEEEDDQSESDAFETMQSRFEKAVLPPPPNRTTKSLRIFLSTTAMPELKVKDGVTLQASGQ